MRFITVKNYEEMSRKAAIIIAAEVLKKEDCVLGLATGSTPVGTYSLLAEMCDAGEIDFSKTRSVNLDEYVGLDVENDQSYRKFMNVNFFYKINIDINNTNVPNGCAEDLDKECARYDALIESMGGVDIQLLGIGVDGHIGFNEPDSEFVMGTHHVTLDESTIQANSRFFESENDVPRSALTMGMKAIMNAKQILMIANGKNKKDILMKALYGPVTPEVPASILQFHPNITVIYSEE